MCIQKQKKIMYFLDFPFSIGGSNKVLLTQAYIISNKGYDVVIVIPNDICEKHSDEYDKLCKKYNLRTVTAQFPIATCVENINIAAVFDSYNEVVCLLKNEKPDLIHSTQLNITVELCARELKIPHLMNIYQCDLEEFNFEWINVFPQYHCSDSILFSKRWGDGLQIESRCIRVAYKNNYKNKLFKNSNNEIVILSIGVLTERKNQLEIIKFILKCKNNDIRVKLILLGEYSTSYGELCKNFVRDNNLEEKVTFQGFVSNVEEYFKMADLLILASLVESYPGVIVESIANKIPVIVTPVAGISEILHNEYNAFITTGYCCDDIYKTFECYLKYKSNGNIQILVERAYETYLNYHTYDVIGLKLEDYYKWIWGKYNKNYAPLLFNNIKEIFDKFIKENSGFWGVHSKKSIWFLYHLNKLLSSKKNKKIVIWGAGFWGKIALEWIELLNSKDNFIGFIDSYKKGLYLGYPILDDIEQCVKDSDFIFLAIGNENVCLEIMDYLEVHGKTRNIDYFLLLNNPIRI